MMLEPRRTLSLSWEEWHRDAKTLASHVLDFGPWRGIVAVTRGGLAPAAIIARALDIRLIETVCVIGYGPDDYNPRRAAEITVVKPPPMHVGDGERWLVVDDLRYRPHPPCAAKIHAESSSRRHLRQASRPAAGRHLRHRGKPGDL